MLGPPEYTEKGKTWFMFTRSLQSSWGGNVKKTNGTDTKI